MSIVAGQVYRAVGTSEGVLSRDDTVQIIRVERGLVDYLMRGIESRITEKMLQSAIDRGDLHLHYQPQFQRSGAAIGF